MSEMVERVARAMFDKLIADDDAYALAQGEAPSNITLDGQFDLHDIARAAILAMAEPTEAMLHVGPSNQSREMVWRRMIGKALAP